jgi:SAM-dependent methyltransferase
MKGLQAIRNIRISHARAVHAEDGTLLPPAWLRLGGHNFERDEDYSAGADRDVERLERVAGLTESFRVLDIGCGVGRLATGIERRFGKLENYTGVDVDAGRIGWCRKHLTGQDVEFVAIDVANERYNPGGRQRGENFTLPLADDSFDVIYLYSVFSHLETADVAGYLHEFRRLLAPGGLVFLTAFIEPDVPDMEVNPAGYGAFPGEWNGPLHCVRFDRGFFDGLVADADLTIQRLDHQSDTDGQSGLVLVAR